MKSPETRNLAQIKDLLYLAYMDSNKNQLADFVEFAKGTLAETRNNYAVQVAIVELLKRSSEPLDDFLFHCDSLGIRKKLVVKEVREMLWTRRAEDPESEVFLEEFATSQNLKLENIQQQWVDDAVAQLKLEKKKANALEVVESAFRTCVWYGIPIGTLLNLLVEDYPTEDLQNRRDRVLQHYLLISMEEILNWRVYEPGKKRQQRRPEIRAAKVAENLDRRTRFNREKKDYSPASLKMMDLIKFLRKIKNLQKSKKQMNQDPEQLEALVAGTVLVVDQLIRSDVSEETQLRLINIKTQLNDQVVK